MLKMKQSLWWMLIHLILTVKLFMILQCLLRSSTENSELVSLESGLGQVNNDGHGYNILNQKNVTFILRPRECDANTKLVLMVSSGPGNAVFRYLDHRGGVSQAHVMTCSRSRWRR